MLYKRLNIEKKTGVCKTIPQGNVIPKLIHQTFLTKDVPAEIAENIRLLKKNNPTWEHHLYDDADISNFILANYGHDILKYYDSIHNAYGAAKADLFRYLLMYQEGGIYLDAKSSVTSSLDSIAELSYPFLITQWDTAGYSRSWHRELKDIDGGEFIQWAIVSTPGHPFLKEVIEKVIRNIEIYNPYFHRVGQKGVLNVTGPIAYTLAIAPLLEKWPHRYIKKHEDALLVYSIYNNAGYSNAHKKIFQKKHYTKLRISLIKPTNRLNAFIWAFAVIRVPLTKAEFHNRYWDKAWFPHLRKIYRYCESIIKK